MSTTITENGDVNYFMTSEWRQQLCDVTIHLLVGTGPVKSRAMPQSTFSILVLQEEEQEDIC